MEIRSAVCWGGTLVHAVGSKPGKTKCGKNTHSTGSAVTKVDLEEYQDLYCRICYSENLTSEPESAILSA